MKRTFQRPLALLLVMVLLMGLLPGTSLAAGDDGRVLGNTGWEDANWGGLTPTITSESDGSLKVEVTASTETTTPTWYSVALQKGGGSSGNITGITGVGRVTMRYTGTGGTEPAHFEVYLGGGDPWVQYKATGTNSDGTVSFEDFYKKNSDSSFETTTSDLSDFSPAQLVIVIGGNSMLPSPITLSDITITAPETKTNCTVTLSATEVVNGTDNKVDSHENFTKAAFQIDRQAASDTSVSVKSGTEITILGKVWPDQTDSNKASYLKTVKVGDGAVQTVPKGKNYTVTVTGDTTIVADYEYLEETPAETTQCTVTLSATENGQAKVNNNDGGTGFTTAAFSIDGTNPVSDTTLTVDSGTKVTVLGAVWLSGTAGDYLDSVTVGGTAQTGVTKGENYEITITGNTAITADYKYLSEKPGTDVPSGKCTVTLKATEGGSDKTGNFIQAVFSVNGTAVMENSITVDKNAEITINSNVWDNDWLESLTVNGETPADFTPYPDQNYTVTVTGDTTITADYRYSTTKPEYTPKPSLPTGAELITHIVPWSADGWLTASGDQTSAGYVYLKHVGGEFDTTKVKEDGKFGLLYQTDTAEPGSKLFLSFSNNSDDTLPWAKVSPSKTESLSGYLNWYRSEFSVADVKTAFGSSFGYMDQIGVWMLDGLHLNAREVKLYYVDGSGAYVVADQSKNPVTGYPWRNQQNQNGGIALIGDSIVHNPRVNSEVGLKPDKGDWNAILGRENCDNYGIGGEQSQHIAARFAELTENGNYQSIVTLFGINNLGTGDETAVTNRVIADYTTVLNTAKATVNNSSKKLEKVFVISLLPSTPLTYEGAQYRIQHVNTALKALCEGDAYKDFVTFVNVYPELLYTRDTPLAGCTANGHDNDGNSFTGYEPHGDPKFFFATDGLHPNAAGYAEIARVLNPLLGGEYASSEGVTGGDANSFGTGGWEYGGDGWSNGGTSTGSLTVTQDGMLKASVRFSSTNWSQAAISNWSGSGHDAKSGMDMISMDVYLEKSAVDASRGTMLSQIYEFGSAVPLNTSGEAVTVNGVQYYKTALNIKGTFKTPFQNFAILFIARNSAFNGNILVDNIAFQKSQNEQVIKVEGSGNFSKNADGTTKTINFGNDESAQTPTYSNSGHSGRLNKGAKIKLTIKLNDVTGTLSGKLKVTVTITGTNGQSTEVTTTIEASAFQDVTRMMRAARSTGTAKIAEVEIDIPESAIQSVENVKTVSVKAESADKTPGNMFSYNGTLDLTELIITNGPAAITSPYVDNGGGGSGGGGGGGGGGSAPMRPVNLPHTWDFSKQADGWKYDKAWNSDYSGSSKTKVMLQDGRLRIDVDFSKDGDKSWSQLAVTLWHDSGMSIKGATHASLDFFYIPGALDGSFAMKLYSNAGIDRDAAIDAEDAEKVQIGSITYNKVTVDFNFPAIRSDKVQDLAICLVGKNTTYKGPLYIDNIALNTEGNDIYVTSKLKPQKSNAALTISGKTLTTASGEKLTLPGQVTMVDGKADESAKSLYAYLKAMGDSKDVLFGQQYSFLQKAGSADLSDSDTYDIVGDYAAIFGLDGLALSGNEFDAGRCNELYGTSYPETAAGHVAATAYLSNKAIERGEIITLSLHMPNFSVVNAVETSAPETYARYDFSGYTPNTLTGDVANEILPGGKYNDAMNAYLDMVADYAKQVDGAVLFRPFHENTGSWFWWGKAFCDPSTYQNIFRYTVEYLRDIKGVHNFIYVYGPGSEAESLADYAERYPGDSYVDMVGFDMYNTAPDVNSGWMKDFEKELNLVAEFAANHNKLVAVTETGAANAPAKGDSQTALLRSGNKDLDWYNRVLNVVSKSQASYFLVWANFGQTSGFYTPYVVRRNSDGSLYGHEMLDNFISYYNEAAASLPRTRKPPWASSLS